MDTFSKLTYDKARRALQDAGVPIYAISLAAFYFSGAYYHLGKRLWGLRYIFTRKVEESEQRVGYEVLGVLLVLQMAVQGYLHLQNTVSVANVGSAAGSSAAPA